MWKSAVCYGSEVWDHSIMPAWLLMLQGVQVAFLPNVCGRLLVAVPAAVILAKLAEDACSLR